MRKCLSIRTHEVLDVMKTEQLEHLKIEIMQAEVRNCVAEVNFGRKGKWRERQSGRQRDKMLERMDRTWSNSLALIQGACMVFNATRPARSPRPGFT